MHIVEDKSSKTPAQIIGENIKSYRNLMAISQDDLSAILGVSRPLISRFESGDAEISMIHLMKLSDLFCIPLSDLLEEHSEVLEMNSKVAFKKEKLNTQDLKAIAGFRKIVKNYINLSK
ncbi:helix-turn-helix domain-containing protein [Fluviicola sp.]|uniref:helix-turn-helix domain-containing protein n=1 Tax=Fluviicola sp. TaxID=1917219 RepID=UPI003D2B1A2A